MTDGELPIVIAGGGIGGLAAALALSQRSISSHVYERRTAFAEEGAGIQLGPNGTKVLNALGLTDALRDAVAIPDALSVRCGVSGRELTRLPLGSWIADRHGAPYWTIHRQDLHAALLARAQSEPRITLHTNSEVLSFENRGDRIDALIAGANPVQAVALIAADGLWSRLRAEVTAAPAITPTGKCAYRGVVQSSNLPKGLAANDIHIWLSPGAHVVHYPVRAGREIAVVVIVNAAETRESWSSPAAKDWLASRAAAFQEPVRSLLQAIDSWRMWPLQTMPPLNTWTQGRVALLGDAAHPVLPFLAQGGVLALEDAAILAQCLADTSASVPDRLAKYAQARMPRTARVARASARNGQIYHLSGALALARNAVLRAAPPERLMAGYNWLYGYKP